jgi:hypothetical protein
MRYIDADKFLDELDKQICSDCIDEDMHCCSCGVGSARAIAKGTPTADAVEVRHGEWIFDFTLNGDDFYHCSICDRQEVLNGLCNERNIATHLPYCHCGAKMNGERREERSLTQ